MAYKYIETYETLVDINTIYNQYNNSNSSTMASLVNDVAGIWNNCLQTSANWSILEDIKKKYKTNTIDDVFVKLHMINKIYNSNVKSHGDLRELSARIANNSLNFTSPIQDLLDQFEEILSDQKGNCINNYLVILSKYFALHAPKTFPIQDKLAIKALDKLITDVPALNNYIQNSEIVIDQREIDKQEIGSYLKKFKSIATKSNSASQLPYIIYIHIVDYFKKEKRLRCDYRKLDKFLWLFGMMLDEGKNNKK